MRQHTIGTARQEGKEVELLWRQPDLFAVPEDPPPVEVQYEGPAIRPTGATSRSSRSAARRSATRTLAMSSTGPKGFVT